jgi:nucleotide-binding universal stress UspA family protein
MATHGRSGINRWLLGSVTEKVLRGTINPLLLIRATDEAKTDGETTVKSLVVPLDGSGLAESVLPTVADLAKKLSLEVVLFRAYNIPYNAYASAEGYAAVDYEELLASMREEAVTTLKTKWQPSKRWGSTRFPMLLRKGSPQMKSLPGDVRPRTT